MAASTAHPSTRPRTAPVTSIAPARIAPLEVRGLTVAYQHKPVLWNIDYAAPDAGLVAIIGPNGAGKTTLIKSILGLTPKLAGEVRICGQAVGRRQRVLVGYVPQRSSVDWDFPTTALDVVTMGLYGQIGWLKPVRRQHRAQALNYLAQLGMADFANRQIGQLSGGQQQRVFLARALAQNARLYLMDEPFAGVDAATERAIADVLKTLRDQGRLVMCVHHDLQTVADYFEHVLILNIQLIASGPLAEAFTADNLHIAYGSRLAHLQLEMVRQRA
jgi:manganese/zinc/iron transport system ATP- binding protein